MQCSVSLWLGCLFRTLCRSEALRLHLILVLQKVPSLCEVFHLSRDGEHYSNIPGKCHMTGVSKCLSNEKQHIQRPVT